MRPFDFEYAIVRSPGRSVVDGLRVGDHDGPSFERVAAEHDAYVAALTAAGVAVEILPPFEAFPDSVFVEDPALAFPEGAILLRPGAPTRLGEVAAIEPALRRRFPTIHSLPDGFADGGDVLVLPGRVLIGLSGRTDAAGAEALVGLLAKLGQRGEIVRSPPDVLHFKSASALVDEETILATASLAASGIFAGFRILVVPEGEERAANAVRVNDVVLAGDCYPRTLEMLDTHGLEVVPLPVTEIAKIDAGLSCMSLRW